MNPFALGPRAIAVWNVVRYMNLYVGGVRHLPEAGPAIVAARHYHHAYDGSALVHGLPRQPHLFVALDWTRSAVARDMMERACRLAEWPVAIRAERFGSGASAPGPSAFERSEMQRYTRRAISYGAELLSRGHVLGIFPEGYPTIDPAGSPKTHDDEYLPFRPGVLAIAAQAERRGAGPIPIVPAGLAYRREGGRTRVTLRLGAPLHDATSRPRGAVLAELEARVRALSQP
ncbi:MAG: hypothetical protein NVS4B5_20440 [Vulcanimicrobiaceae bacterium]